MQPLNELCVVKVVEYRGTTDGDKNNETSVMFIGQAGRLPNRNVVSGTVAANGGFEIGKTYLAQVRELGEHVIHGRQFTWLALQEITDVISVIKAKKELGDPEIVTIPKPEASRAYKRITNAVEGLQTQQTKDGLFKPAYPRTATDHQTAGEVIKGTSITTANEEQLLTPEEAEKRLNEGDINRGERNKTAERNLANSRRLRSQNEERRNNEEGDESEEDIKGSTDR